MAQRNNQLIEGWVDTWAAYLFDIGFRVEGDRDTFRQLFFSLCNKLSSSQLRRKSATPKLGLTEVNKTCSAYSPTVFCSCRDE